MTVICRETPLLRLNCHNSTTNCNTSAKFDVMFCLTRIPLPAFVRFLCAVVIRQNSGQMGGLPNSCMECTILSDFKTKIKITLGTGTQIVGCIWRKPYTISVLR